MCDNDLSIIDLVRFGSREGRMTEGQKGYPDYDFLRLINHSTHLQWVDLVNLHKKWLSGEFGQKALEFWYIESYRHLIRVKLRDIDENKRLFFLDLDLFGRTTKLSLPYDEAYKLHYIIE